MDDAQHFRTPGILRRFEHLEADGLERVADDADLVERIRERANTCL